jgi:hypothetical protein
VSVLDVDADRDRPRMLVAIDRGDSRGSARQGADLFLCGRDGMHWFAKRVPPFRHVTRIADALDVLALLAVAHREAAISGSFAWPALPEAAKSGQTIVSNDSRRKAGQLTPLANLSGWLL